MILFKALQRDGCASLTVALAALIMLVFAATATGEPLGLQSVEVSALNENGTPDVQAGSHPYVLTASFLLNKPERVSVGHDEYLFRIAGGGLKDVHAELPPGFIGNTTAVPRCTYHDFGEHACPNDTAIGEATTRLSEINGYIGKKGHEVGNILAVTNPVYNLEPPGAVPAEFGYDAKGIAPIFLDTTVRTGGDYGLTTIARNISEAIAVYGSTVKIWGVPEDPSHDALRGRCLGEGESQAIYEEIDGFTHNEEESRGDCPVNVPVEPLLTNPTSCGVPRSATLSADSWGEPNVLVSKTATLPELTGCEKLDFSPTLSVTPDGTAGSTPTGVNVDVHIPQEATTNPVGLGEADIKDIVVALPPGIQISPSGSDGLQACSAGEIGFTDFAELDPLREPGVRTPQFRPRLPGSADAAQAGENEQLRPGVNFCPDASKIATVKIATPLLEHELTGAVYLAAPQNFSLASGAPLENPFGSLIAMYLVAEEPATGVLVKLPGRVSLCEAAGETIDGKACEAAGQIVTAFEDLPQAPISESEFSFFGTDRAPLATPGLCGTYTTTTSLTPWSGQEAKDPSSNFQITSGPAGSPCANPLPFSPALASGSTNINAGSFSALTTTLSREDGQQNIQQVTLRYPPGLSGILSGVKLCGEAQADAGTCGPESEIGETIVSVGLGNDPFSVTGGRVYLTGPYEGAPFGLSIVNPAKAGPFDLQEGRPVVVRATVGVDPHTAALTVTTNTATQGHAIPSMIEGIPLQIKHVNVNITRPGFTFNPTNCNPTKITGTVASAEDASSPVSIPFQVTNCANLKFAPQFSVSTQGKTSKLDGASLTAKVTYPNVPQGTDADIASVKVELPKQLPSRLSTLQKACTAAQFNTNYADCPAASVIGHAVVHTPLLPVPLEGPAYFVSNGGEAFPNLIIVLQGYGITIDLVGDTFISKTGITSTTFKTVPDQPFSSFELTLPEGPYSALAANGDLCSLTKTVTVKKKIAVKVKGHRKTETREVRETQPGTLEVPSAFVGQNGAEIHQDTPVTVSGCPRATAKDASKKKHKRTSGGEKGRRRQ